jgi:hypothetical protein
MCAKGEKRGQTSSSREEVGRAKSNPRTRVVGFIGPIWRLPSSRGLFIWKNAEGK